MDGLLSSPWVSIVQNVLSGAVGALLASWDARARRHHSALVRLQWLFNQELNRLSDNQLHVRGMVKNTAMGAVHFTWPTPLLTDQSAYSDLVNLGLINELMSLYATIEKVNHDVANLHSAYEQLVNGLVTKAISPDQFQTQATDFGKKMQLMGSAYAHIETETKQLLCTVRVLARRDLPITGRVTLWFVRSRMPKQAEIDEERGKLEEEIERTKSASTEEIARISGAVAEGR